MEIKIVGGMLVSLIYYTRFRRAVTTTLDGSDREFVGLETTP